MMTDTATIDPIAIGACSPTLRARVAACYREAAASYRALGRHDDARTYEDRAAIWEADTVRPLAELLTAGVTP